MGGNNAAAGGGLIPAWGFCAPGILTTSEPARNTPAPAFHEKPSADADWSTGYIFQITAKDFISILVLPRVDVFPYLSLRVVRILPSKPV